jgi:zinc transport system substrate-binding protein
MSLVLLVAGCTREAEKVGVVVSTPMIQAIAAETAGPRIGLSVVVPEGVRPEGFKLAAREIDMIRGADLLIYHGWEPWVPVAVDSSPPPVRAAVGIGGNWMVPDIHLEALREIRNHLIAADPEGTGEYRERALRYENQILREAGSVCRDLAPCRGTQVIAEVRHSDILDWAGFEILATFDGEDPPSGAELERIADTGRTYGVKLVVGDRRGGPAERLASQLGARYLILPSSLIDNSYPQTLKQIGDSLRAVCMEHSARDTENP